MLINIIPIRFIALVLLIVITCAYGIVFERFLSRVTTGLNHARVLIKFQTQAVLNAVQVANQSGTDDL